MPGGTYHQRIVIGRSCSGSACHTWAGVTSSSSPVCAITTMPRSGRAARVASTPPGWGGSTFGFCSASAAACRSTAARRLAVPAR